jgi:hypothetical protein
MGRDSGYGGDRLLIRHDGQPRLTTACGSERLREMRRPSLKAEDGAEFVGELQRIDDGRLFLAICYARLEYGDVTQTEDHEFHTCASEEEAEKWIAARAKQCGFAGYRLKP